MTQETVRCPLLTAAGYEKDASCNAPHLRSQYEHLLQENCCVVDDFGCSKCVFTQIRLDVVELGYTNINVAKAYSTRQILQTQRSTPESHVKIQILDRAIRKAMQQYFRFYRVYQVYAFLKKRYQSLVVKNTRLQKQ